MKFTGIIIFNNFDKFFLFNHQLWLIRWLLLPWTLHNSFSSWYWTETLLWSIFCSISVLCSKLIYREKQKQCLKSLDVFTFFLSCRHKKSTSRSCSFITNNNNYSEEFSKRFSKWFEYVFLFTLRKKLVFSSSSASSCSDSESESGS